MGIPSRHRALLGRAAERAARFPDAAGWPDDVHADSAPERPHVHTHDRTRTDALAAELARSRSALHATKCELHATQRELDAARQRLEALARDLERRHADAERAAMRRRANAPTPPRPTDASAAPTANATERTARSARTEPAFPPGPSACGPRTGPHRGDAGSGPLTRLARELLATLLGGTARELTHARHRLDPADDPRPT